MQFGMTALHHAAISGELDTIRVLVQELHMDPDIGDRVSYTNQVCAGMTMQVCRQLGRV